MQILVCFGQAEHLTIHTENESKSILNKRSWLTIMITYRCAELPKLNE